MIVKSVPPSQIVLIGGVVMVVERIGIVTRHVVLLKFIEQESGIPEILNSRETRVFDVLMVLSHIPEVLVRNV